MLDDSYTTRQYYNKAGDANAQASLSLLIGKASLMYAVFNADFSALSELVHVTQKQEATGPLQDEGDWLRRMLDNFQLRSRKFAKVFCAVQGRNFVLLPEAYVPEDGLRPVLRFSSGQAEVRNTLSHHLAGVQFSFEPQPLLVSEVERNWNNAALRHSGAVNISLLLQHRSLASADILLVLGDGVMELCARRNNELLFYNQFDVQGDEDVLYYLLFMLDQFQLDPAVVRLAVCAQKEADDALLIAMKKHIRHVQLPADGTVKMGGELSRIPAHYYFPLLNQHLCEL
jgi:hypothetical protein